MPTLTAHLIEAAATGVEVAAAAPVVFGCLQALWQAAGAAAPDLLSVRLRLGTWLALGLELALAADILRTAAAPTWNDLGQLAAIAAIRTALNALLEREMERHRGARAAAA